jgi:hypothetical protein
MSSQPALLPDDPIALKAMVAALQAQNTALSATVRVFEQGIANLQLRIAKLKRQAFGKASEKVEREIEQLEVALEGLLIAKAEASSAPASDEDDAPESTQPAVASKRAPRPRPRVSAETPRERRELDPGTACPDCGGALRVVGEDVSEMLDLIAARLKVIEIGGSKNPVAPASGWCRPPHRADRSQAAWPPPRCWPTFWSPSSMTTCHSTG